MPVLNIEAVDDALVAERVESFGGGMDAYSRSTLLAPDAYQYSENARVLPDLEHVTRAGADKLGTDGAARVQGLLYFDIPTGAAPEQLIRATNAVFEYWNGSTWTAMTGFTVNDAIIDFMAQQGVDKALFTDGVQEMRIWDGTAWSAALGTADVSPPKGATILLWHAERMWAAGFTGTVAGKENDAMWGSALLQFGNGDWDATNRNIRIGGGDGDPIKGLASLSSSFDKGFAMAVLKANSIYIVNTDPTATFTNFTANIGPEQVGDGIGCVGKRAFCVFGNDLLFVSPDRNFYSLARMQNAQGQYQIGAPLSLPIKPFVDRINWTYASKIAVVKYRELALFSVPLDAATENDTIFVWNGLLQRWTGIWTGWTPTDWAVTRFSDVHHLTYGDKLGSVKQWKDLSDALDDATYLDDGAAIATKLWTRAFLFQEPLNPKDAFHSEARFSTSNAQPTFSLVCDNQEVTSWVGDVRRVGPTLPIQLPFQLTAPTNIPIRKGLRGQPVFNECYITIESTSGWWALRNVSMTAFLNTLANQ